MRALRSPTLHDAYTAVLKSTTEALAGFLMITLTTGSSLPPGCDSDNAMLPHFVVSRSTSVLSDSISHPRRKESGLK
jgi:hypothetical protein